MEEKEKILLPEEPGTTKGAEKNSLPVAGTQYEGANNESGNKLLLPGRISTALMKNTVSTVSSLEKEYGSPINEIVVEGSLDRQGNLIKLDTMGTRTLISLSKQIFQANNEDVNKYLELTESERKKPANLRDEKKLKDTPKVVINILSISTDLFGKREGSKPRQLIKTFEELEKISKIRIPQIISEGIAIIENEKVPAIRKLLEPYICITGSEEQITYIRRIKTKDENKEEKITEEKVTIPIFVEIIAGRIFYEHNWIGKGSKHFPLPNGILDARLPSGRAITTDIYWKGLFMLAGTYRYHAYSINYQQVLQKIKNENIIDSERIAQLKEDALTCNNIPIQRIREIVGFESELKEKIEEYKKKKKDPSERNIASIIRVYKLRFKEQFWDAMWALIERGIITDKSDIFWEKDTFKFVFTENKIAEPLNAPGTKMENERRPGGKWSKNPFAKDDSKKRKKKHSSDMEPDLFTE